MQQKKHRKQLNNGMNGTSDNQFSISKEEFQTQATANKKISKKLVATAIVEVCILMMMSFAWYYYQSHRKVISEEREVMAPYYLYLVDETGQDFFSLTVGNLHPGEVKQIILGVTNKKPNNDDGISYNVGKDSIFDYELELAYTQNLPLEYKVYELQKQENGESTNGSLDENSITVNTTNSEGNEPGSVSFTKTLLTQKYDTESISNKNNEEMYRENYTSTVNLGQYDIYDKSSKDGTNLNLATTVKDGTVTFDLDYYLIELEWEDDIDFSDYLKETDLVYVIVKAMQLEPEEVTETVQ